MPHSHPLTGSRNLFDLDGAVAVVTGSTRGIGRATAEWLLRYGARVTVSGRDPHKTAEAAAELDPTGTAVLPVACNISNEDDLEQIVEKTVERWGRIDVLVCNAAVSPYFGPAAQMPRSAYQKVIDCNITANVILTNKVAPIMADNGGGSIVIVSSIGGQRGSTHLGAYAISKAADMQLARNLAVEWGPQGVRANCVAPGLIRTDMAAAFVDQPDVLRRRVHHTPLQRIGEVDEVAAAIVMLAGPGGGYISGQTIVIDGGTVAGSPWQTEGGEEPGTAEVHR